MTAPHCIAGNAPLLIIADHASNAVPPGIDLGIDPALLDEHIAIDIGTAALSAALAAQLGARAIIATVSRLVIDGNRDPAVADVIPAASDGHVIAGNLLLSATERTLRIDAIHSPYHAAIAAEIARAPPALIISVHSFTQRLATRPDEHRPWPVGILHNEDDRGARAGMAWLVSQGVMVGDNQPYSGRVLNYTMDRHAEAGGIAYLGLEVRNDGLRDAAGMARWAALLGDCIRHVAASF